jgi:hypothetical protein
VPRRRPGGIAAHATVLARAAEGNGDNFPDYDELPACTNPVS